MNDDDDIDDSDTPYQGRFAHTGLVVEDCEATCRDGPNDGAGYGQTSA